MSDKKSYDTTLARMAGNIAATLDQNQTDEWIIARAVKIARGLIEEIKRTRSEGECDCGAKIGQPHTDDCAFAAALNKPCSRCGERHSIHNPCRSDWTGVDKHGR